MSPDSLIVEERELEIKVVRKGRGKVSLVNTLITFELHGAEQGRNERLEGRYYGVRTTTEAEPEIHLAPVASPQLKESRE